MMGMRGNRVDTQAGDVPLETIHQGKVLKKLVITRKDPFDNGVISVWFTYYRDSLRQFDWLS